MMNSYKLDYDESELSLQKASSYFHPFEDFLLTASLKYNWYQNPSFCLFGSAARQAGS